MLDYKYTARNSATGEQIKAVVQADSEGAAVQFIRDQGLVPVDIKQSGGRSIGFLSGYRNRVKTRDKVLFSRQLSTLINAGLPLMQGLRSVNQQTMSRPLKVILNQITSDIEGGSKLSDAMAKHPQVFSPVFISLVSAGEASGTLDTALDRIALQQEKDADLAAKVRGAMMYPAIVLLVMLAVVGFMIVKVLPQVKGIYNGLPGGAQLPFITRVLLAVSDFVIGYWWIVIIVLGLLAFFTTRWARTGPGKEVIDAYKIKGWPVGKLFMKMYMARFSRTAATLISSGVPLLKVLEITSDAVNNVHIQRSIQKAAEKVKGGKSLADAIQNDPNFLPLVPNMVKIGEQSGAMEKMLSKAADYYEKEVDNEIAAISSIIEPVMMVVLGIVALIIVGAVLMPIYGLAGNDSFTNPGN